MLGNIINARGLLPIGRGGASPRLVEIANTIADRAAGQAAPGSPKVRPGVRRECAASRTPAANADYSLV